MNYIYDIYLNFNETLYDFFDWNKNDKLMHIKKIPIFKINVDNLKSLIKCTIKLDEKFLKYVYNKTEILNNDKNYSCALFSDGNNILAINFDNNGKSIQKSSLYIDDELEILDTYINQKEQDLDFKILKSNKPILKTRKEQNEKKFISKELKKIDLDKLYYVYFECFGKKEKDKEKIIKKISKIKENTNTYKKLYNLLKLTSTK